MDSRCCDATRVPMTGAGRPGAFSASVFPCKCSLDKIDVGKQRTDRVNALVKDTFDEAGGVVHPSKALDMFDFGVSFAGKHDNTFKDFYPRFWMGSKTLMILFEAVCTGNTTVDRDTFTMSKAFFTRYFSPGMTMLGNEETAPVRSPPYENYSVRCMIKDYNPTATPLIVSFRFVDGDNRLNDLLFRAISLWDAVNEETRKACLDYAYLVLAGEKAKACAHDLTADALFLALMYARGQRIHRRTGTTEVHGHLKAPIPFFDMACLLVYLSDDPAFGKIPGISDPEDTGAQGGKFERQVFETLFMFYLGTVHTPYTGEISVLPGRIRFGGPASLGESFRGDPGFALDRSGKNFSIPGTNSWLELRMWLMYPARFESQAQARRRKRRSDGDQTVAVPLGDCEEFRFTSPGMMMVVEQDTALCEEVRRLYRVLGMATVHEELKTQIRDMLKEVGFPDLGDDPDFVRFFRGYILLHIANYRMIFSPSESFSPSDIFNPDIDLFAGHEERLLAQSGLVIILEELADRARASMLESISGEPSASQKKRRRRAKRGRGGDSGSQEACRKGVSGDGAHSEGRGPGSGSSDGDDPTSADDDDAEGEEAFAKRMSGVRVGIGANTSVPRNVSVVHSGRPCAEPAFVSASVPDTDTASWDPPDELPEAKHEEQEHVVPEPTPAPALVPAPVMVSPLRAPRKVVRRVKGMPKPRLVPEPPAETAYKLWGDVPLPVRAPPPGSGRTSAFEAIFGGATMPDIFSDHRRAFGGIW